MADISKIKLPNGTTYNVKDSSALHSVPKASTTTLGGVKVGSGLNVDSNGVLSASGEGTVTFEETTTTEVEDDILSRVVLNKLYPVGTIYVSANSTSPSSVFPNTVWARVSDGYTLQTPDSSHAVRSYTSAGLPNITGNLGQTVYASTNGSSGGAFTTGTNSGSSVANGSWATLQNRYFDASRGGADPIYGKSDTVQPPSYRVYMWERIS